MSNGYLANASQAAEKLSSEPFDSASLRSGRTAGVDCPALPFMLSVALRAMSKHERLFQHPAKATCTAWTVFGRDTAVKLRPSLTGAGSFGALSWGLR